jgi:CIC family chloride channel protein
VTEVLEAMVIHQSRIPAKTALFKGLTASVTIASGGSVGREGPVVQIGSAVGSAIGQKLGVSRSQLRTLIGCGAAAGISASFDAPIAGAMFALEIILADFGVATFSPIVLSSVVATVVSRALYNTAHVPTGDLTLATATSQLPREMVQATYKLVSSFEIGPYLILGFVCGIVSIAFIASLDRAEDLFEGHWGGFVGRWLGALPAWMKPAVGGLILGCLGLLVPRMLGTGYETMNATLKGELATGLVFAVLVTKIIGTSLTLGSGGSGGSFFPAVFIGAMTGSAFGGTIHRLFPTMTATSGAYALVGMGALVAGATQAPLTGIIMMFELTGDYQIILPLMVACLSASLLVDRWLGQSIYTLKLAHKGINPRGGRELDMLRRIPVRAAMTRSVPLIPQSMPFKELLGQLSSTPHVTYVVVDDESRYMGIISLQDVREFFFEEGLNQVVVAGDLARTDVKPLAEDEDLQVGLERLAPLETELLPVASSGDPSHIVGMLSRRSILLAYQNPQGTVASR